MPSTSGSNPTGDLQLVQGGGHGDHPKVVLKLNGQECSTPFTLEKNSGTDEYSIVFQNNFARDVLAFAMGFTGGFPQDGQLPPASEVKFRWALNVPAGGIGTLRFPSADAQGATKLWVGSWWANGDYPDNATGRSAYFNDHRVGGGHHTVPVIITN